MKISVDMILAAKAAADGRQRAEFYRLAAMLRKVQPDAFRRQSLKSDDLPSASD